MISFDLQLFGGRGGNGSRNTVSGEREIRRIARAPFKSRGGGIWEMSVSNSENSAGGQILDEQGSSYALRNGYDPEDRLYSAKYWDKNGNVSDSEYFGTLNEAKIFIRERLIANVRQKNGRK